MPILNMNYWANKGWANIGEPTNISATVTSDSATITWTDNDLNTIPQSTFFKSILVRKVGSAPTSPSDWTTVVTETVKNTYSSSGYTDTWLTAWTTYYYQVFSYSDLWGITYWTPVSVTPQNQWQPWANTVVYYKINDNDTNSTIYDLSWNSLDQTWYGTPWYTTDADYGRVAVFNWNSYTQGSGKADFYDEFTIIALVKPSSANRCMFISQNQSSSLRPIWMSINAWWSWKFEWVIFDGYAIQSSTSVQWNVRQMVAISYDGSGNRRIYVNWELDNTATQTVTSYTTWSNLTLWQRWNNADYYNWQLKLLIGEDRCWTDQEIADIATEYWFNPN